MIRITPIGGEPVELPEDTACVRPGKYRSGALTAVAIDEGIGAMFRTPDGRGAFAEVLRAADIAHVADPPQAFVHIGDAWPLCEVETWRQRAERLERELAALYEALKRQPCLATVRFMPDCQCIPCVARREGEPEDEVEEEIGTAGWYCGACKDQPNGCAICR